MTSIGRRPSTSAPSLLGGSIDLPPAPCRHEPARSVSPWVGEPGTSGVVAVVGAGKMGLPLSAQFAGHGWSVIAVDVQRSVVDAINEGRSHVDEEPGLGDLVKSAHDAGRLRATTDAAAAAREADVVVLIVPVMLDDEQQPDYRSMDAAVASIAPGVHAGSTVIFETTLPVGDTRSRYLPRLEAATGLNGDDGFFVAFSPERLYSGAALRNLATYPKLVGGVGQASGERAAAFYASVLDAEVVLMSSAEAAEFSKLADTTYRDVNIALANEFARYADRVGVDIQEVIAAANSQPYSHIHQPGLGVGGHCIPVYPHFLLSRAPEMELVELSRRVNDGQVGLAIRQIQRALGGLDGVPVLVLGLTYREGVKELAYSRAVPLIERLRFHGAQVSAYDPLLTADEIEQCCATAYRWGESGPFRAIVTQTADPRFATLDFGLFPELTIVFDGRNSLREVELPAGVEYQGVGVPGRGGDPVPATAGPHRANATIGR
jgi:nucleotide sugar dehydrogenase